MITYAKRNFLRLFLVLALLATALLSGCSPVQSESAFSEQGLVQYGPKSQDQHQTQERINNEEQTNVTNKAKETPSDTSETNLETPVNIEAPTEQSKPSEEPFAEQDQKQLHPSISAIPILYYHSIDYEEGNELRIPPEEFEAHMQLLHQKGYESISLDNLYRYFYEGKVLPERAFVLTFDDGYEDNYVNAFPIAEKYGYQGTIFMVTEWIGGTGYLKREQLLEMSKAGWQIESHTLTHPYLNSIPTDEIKDELHSSKKILEELLDKQVNFFAYPYGVYDLSIIELSKEIGYKMGLTTDRGWAVAKDPFRVQRIYCYAQMGLDELKRRIETPNY